MPHSCLSVPNRRALLASAALSLAAPAVVLAAAPVASAPPPDPHPAMLPEVLRLWREHKRTAFGWGQDTNSVENEAADAAYDAMCDAVLAVAEMPAPRTVEGLAAVAVAVGLMAEGHVSEDGCDFDRVLGALIAASLSALGAEMPADWTGVMYRSKAERVALAGEDAR